LSQEWKGFAKPMARIRPNPIVMSPLARRLFMPEKPTAAGTMMVVVGSGSTPMKPQFEM
jgi:hypothetical protein